MSHKERGSILVGVLVFAALIAIVLGLMFDRLLLQTKMAENFANAEHNYQRQRQACQEDKRRLLEGALLPDAKLLQVVTEEHESRSYYLLETPACQRFYPVVVKITPVLSDAAAS